jgi:GcrA cell cycle regulator
MSDWTEAETSLAIQLASDGSSARQIATALMTKTRNAVIGRLQRLGVKLGHKRSGPRKLRIRAKQQPMLQRKLVNIRVNSSEPIPEGKIDLIDLKQHHCRWPYGIKDFKFCGLKKHPRSSYCPEHFWLSRRIYND